MRKETNYIPLSLFSHLGSKVYIELNIIGSVYSATPVIYEEDVLSLARVARFVSGDRVFLPRLIFHRANKSSSYAV